MLTNKQIKHLKTLAHPLGVILQTGSNGLTQAIQDEIKIALKAHELIKVKLNTDREERETMIASIKEEQKCDIVQYIGKTIVLYKRNTNNIKIEFPQG